MDTNTLLNYELTTEPFPVRASSATDSSNLAKFTVVASNPNPERSVTIRKISITIPIGTSGAELSITQPPDPIPPADWRLVPPTVGAHIVEYVFKPLAGKGGVGEQGLAFIFNAVQINMQPGTVNIAVEEEVADGVATRNLKITKFPTGWGQVTFWANPEIVAAGDLTTLNWSGPSGATYTIEYFVPQRGIVHVPAQGEKPLANQGKYQPSGELERNTIFYLTVRAIIDNQEYFARQSVMVTVQSVKISATGPEDPVNALEHVEIKWTTLSAQTVTIEPGRQTANAVSGSGKFTVQPTSNTTYTLIAKDAKGREKRAVLAVYVNPPQITSFKATPAAAKPGSLVTLSWETVSSAFTSLAPSIGKVNGSGHAQVVALSGTTSYMLTAQSQPPFAIETVNVIGAQPGFHQVVSDMKYADVDGALVIGKKLFLLNTYDKKLWFSADGLALNPVDVVKPWRGATDGNRSVVFDAGKGPRIWILGGRNGGDPNNSVWRATDEIGTSWEQVEPVNNKIWSPRCFFGCVVFKNKIWVFGGWDARGHYNSEVWSSPDGANWTLETQNPGWSPRGFFAATTFTLGQTTNQIWLCGGIVGNDYTNEVYYTNDGVQWLKWTVKTVPWAPRSTPLLQQIGESLWLMGGSISNSTPLRDVWTIAGPPQNHVWTGYTQEAPWPIINNGGAPWTSVVFNGLMWCAGSNGQYAPNPGIWYFLP